MYNIYIVLLNENKDKTYQNLRNSEMAIFRRKFITIIAQIRKEKRPQLCKLLPQESGEREMI